MIDDTIKWVTEITRGKIQRIYIGYITVNTIYYLPKQVRRTFVSRRHLGFLFPLLENRTNIHSFILLLLLFLSSSSHAMSSRDTCNTQASEGWIRVIVGPFAREVLRNLFFNLRSFKGWLLQLIARYVAHSRNEI